MKRRGSNIRWTGNVAHRDLAYWHDSRTPQRGHARQRWATQPPLSLPGRSTQGIASHTSRKSQEAVQGGSRSHVRLPRPLTNNHTAPSTRSSVHGPNPSSDGPSAAVGENSSAGGAGLIPVLLRRCPVPFFPDTKDHRPRPAAAVLATVPWDTRNLPTFSLNRLFSWPGSSPCFTRHLSIESPRGTETPGSPPAGTPCHGFSQPRAAGPQLLSAAASSPAVGGDAIKRCLICSYEHTTNRGLPAPCHRTRPLALQRVVEECAGTGGFTLTKN
jgi:hypothetical protein